MRQTSFIQFFPSLQQSFDAMGDPDESPIKNNGFVQLSPVEFYLQTTESDTDIAFNGNYIAELIDCCENVKADVSGNIFLYEFTDTATGIRQAHISMAFLPFVLGNPDLILRITQTDGDLVIYSTKFKINPNISGTSRLDYDRANFNGNTSQRDDNFRNGIRIKARFTIPKKETTATTYDQTSGHRIQLSETRIFSYNYIIEYITNLGNMILGAVVDLPVLYINGIRSTSTNYSTDDVNYGTANFYAGKLTGFPNLNDTYKSVLQVAVGLAFTDRQPLGLYTPTSFATITELYGRFNKPVTIGTGTLKVYDASDDSVIATYTEADITQIGSDSFSITDFATLGLGIGKYYIKFTAGLFLSMFLETIDITDKTSWPFQIKNGVYDHTKYNNVKYLID